MIHFFLHNSHNLPAPVCQYPGPYPAQPIHFHRSHWGSWQAARSELFHHFGLQACLMYQAHRPECRVHTACSHRQTVMWSTSVLKLNDVEWELSHTYSCGDARGACKGVPRASKDKVSDRARGWNCESPTSILVNPELYLQHFNRSPEQSFCGHMCNIIINWQHESH